MVSYSKLDARLKSSVPPQSKLIDEYTIRYIGWTEIKVAGVLFEARIILGSCQNDDNRLLAANKALRNKQGGINVASVYK